MLRFAAIALPETYRRSSLAAQLGRHAHVFALLLAQLAPRAYARLVDASLEECYNALLIHCARLFPIWIPDYMMDECESEEQFLYYAEGLGIPVSPYGIPDWDLQYGHSAALCAVAYFLRQPTTRVAVPEMDKRRDGIGKSWTGLRSLEPWHERQISMSLINPPKGRQWRGRWSSLPWLVKYIEHDTGYQWLDLSNDDMDDGVNPPWSLYDIRYLARDWAEAEQVWKPLRSFVGWLDARPAERLPIVLGALTGDERVRARITEPLNH